jgi:hypothetical protein
LDREEKTVWLKLTTEEGELEVGIPPAQAYGLGLALQEAVSELGFEGDPSSDPKVAN